MESEQGRNVWDEKTNRRYGPSHTSYPMGPGLMSKKPDYVPPSKPWEMSEVLEGLLEFALRMLKPNGRLVYWLPTASQDYSHADVPQRNGLRLVANSCQDFGKWQRRLITMQKDPTTLSDDGAPQCSNSSQHNQAEESLPGHRHFRDKYMKGFS
ncbi:hypothetical protein PGTUg99_019994 [Puccinia graminis f. sp. tritici]|uniref:Uncharacterized protein n=1 Tax=Puccinia graminis f. sp. tritici TaxID=56615 RepID=A0A5B0SJL6_PUCGR|nr:hypothetical protein PGTUg99_019994 [Puccinia graminis f. sp. tritici]